MTVGKIVTVFLSLIFMFNRVQCIYDLELDEIGSSDDIVGIFGGHGIKINEVPYMASLRIDRRQHFCGASIIHEQFILTAAHCIVPNRKYNIKVGSDIRDQGGKLYEIDEIFIHENYNSSTFDYDISVIKLTEPLEFGTDVNKIRLSNKSPQRTKIVQVTGWGSTDQNGTLSDRLMQVSMPVVAFRNCKKTYSRYNQILTSRMFCAGEIGKDSCVADSGGPLTMHNEQVGIVSFGLSICGVKPGVYTKIKSLKSWIFKTIDENS